MKTQGWQQIHINASLSKKKTTTTSTNPNPLEIRNGFLAKNLLFFADFFWLFDASTRAEALLYIFNSQQMEGFTSCVPPGLKNHIFTTIMATNGWFGTEI